MAASSHRSSGSRSRQGFVALLAWVSPLLTTAACLEMSVDPEASELEGGSGRGNSDDPQDTDSPPGSCNAWKIGYCNAVTRCSFESREQCELDVGYLMCRDDAPLGACIERMSEAECSAMPSDCRPAAIADRTLPTEVCRELQAEHCEWSLYCGYEFSLEGCQVNLAAAQPCTEFTAVLPGYEQCLEEYRTLPCNGQLPASCEGLLRR